ncbi:hypothetical protein QTP88_004809 [Uroleucon formosanum]
MNITPETLLFGRVDLNTWRVGAHHVLSIYHYLYTQGMKTEKHGGPPVYNNLPLYVQISVNSVLQFCTTFYRNRQHTYITSNYYFESNQIKLKNANLRINY